MSLRFVCECGAPLTVDPEMAGKKVRCPTCRSAIAVPASSAESRRPAHRSPKLAEPDDEDDEDDEEPEARRSSKKKSNKVVVRFKTNTTYVLPTLLSMSGIVALAAGGFLLKEPIPRAIVSIAILLAVYGGAFGFALLVLFVLMPKNTRLVMDSKYVDLESRSGSLLGRIPIRNISGLESTRRVETYRELNGRPKEKIVFLVEVRLVDHKDDDTFWPGWYGKRGESIEIQNEYEKSLTWIKGRIQTRIDRYRQSRRDGESR